MSTRNNTKETDIVFVADFFTEDLVGGAELTTEALVESSPLNVKKIRSSQLTEELINSNKDSYWIFGNWSGVDTKLIVSAASSLNYSILEYDYKICKYRSPEKHYAAEGSSCNCHKTQLGQLISLFYGSAKSIFWMSERQMKRYHAALPHLKKNEQIVLSSVFSKSFFQRIDELNSQDHKRNGWIVLDSSSWIKGTEDAESWCYANDKEMKRIGGVSPDQFLEEMSKSQGLVYLPRGGDTCPRLVIEAKLLGCDLSLNDLVEHSPEDWFNSSPQEIVSYLKASPDRFWKKILESTSYEPTISGYLTTKDCISQKYPYEECIQSMLSFCDEVVVVDGGSTDGTWKRLEDMASENKKIKIHKIERDWNHTRFAVFDGLQKAEARNRCTMKFCWQMDADEVVPPWDAKKIKDLCKRLGTATELVSLPVVEYWGSIEKVRIDVTPWKWRLSWNDNNITHGIPSRLRRFDTHGLMHAYPGTDGCDYIYRDSGELVPHASFYSQQADEARMAAINGNIEALKAYENWFKQVVSQLPSVRHFSWIDIKRKMLTYKNYWQKHWESLYGIRQEDTAENNKFFDKPWSQVTEDEINELSKKMAKELGGHVFHSKINWSKPTPWIKGFDQ